jgi:ADP-ribose pyrophosphatase
VSDVRQLTLDELRDEATAWPVVAERVLGSGDFTTLLQDDILAPDGETLSREYLRHPGAVGIIALDDQDRVAVVRQYRHAVRYRLLEAPAGLLDVEGEEPLLAARRELAEEVGLAGRFREGGRGG